ncbi:unnamed protein product [Protopolystoma xenopodis]|uniref:Uncharacterized protein n=1 Tax=Protopolystoma xenopodis TaxID=117903 RepID=A0A448XBH3_9PLAT|nr:unnamed protein product [Protopolystoma xenopodis]
MTDESSSRSHRGSRKVSRGDIKRLRDSCRQRSPTLWGLGAAPIWSGVIMFSCLSLRLEDIRELGPRFLDSVRTDFWASGRSTRLSALIDRRQESSP